ncbi:MAG TPA: hypothetical protein PKD68_04510 [Candidatus Saccharibacteria bacterium]|nr:hypothetical protein [Candidatus Saccharibacteria bacterium]
MTRSDSSEAKRGWFQTTGDFLKKPVAVVAAVGALGLSACAQEKGIEAVPGDRPTTSAPATPGETPTPVESTPTQSPEKNPNEDKEKYFKDKYTMPAGLSTDEQAAAFVDFMTNIVNEGATPELAEELFSQNGLPAMIEFGNTVAVENMEAVMPIVFSEAALRDEETRQIIENLRDINGAGLLDYTLTTQSISQNPVDKVPYRRDNYLKGVEVLPGGVLMITFEHLENDEFNRIRELRGDDQEGVEGTGTYIVAFDEIDGRTVVDSIHTR